MDEVATRQISTIEAALRNSNYRVADWNEGNEVLSDLFCECGYISCSGRMSLPRIEYDRVRSHSRRFFVLPGHHVPTAEKVVEEHEGWIVVEKPFEAKDDLERMDDPPIDSSTG